jgi:hypothetical protein
MGISGERGKTFLLRLLQTLQSTFFRVSPFPISDGFEAAATRSRSRSCPLVPLWVSGQWVAMCWLASSQSQLGVHIRPLPAFPSSLDTASGSGVRT